MNVVPMTLSDAREYVTRVHRHHRAPVGGLFAIGAAVGDEIVGCVIVGRPVSRMLDDGFTAEVTRPGTSLRAAGWKEVGRTDGGSWDRADRPRIDRHPTEPKIRWEAA